MKFNVCRVDADAVCTPPASTVIDTWRCDVLGQYPIDDDGTERATIFLYPAVFLVGKLFLGLDPWATRPEADIQTLREAWCHFSSSTPRMTWWCLRARRKAQGGPPRGRLLGNRVLRHVGAYAHLE